MAKITKTNKAEFSIVNLKRLAEISNNITYARLYNILVLKRYNSLTDDEKTILSNAMFVEINKAFKALGFKISINRN